MAQSVQRLATGRTVLGSNAGGGEIFRTCSDRAWGPLSRLYNGYRVSPGVSRPGRGVDHSPHLTTELKEYIYTSIPLRAFEACYRVTFIFSLPVIRAAGVLGFMLIRYGLGGGGGLEDRRKVRGHVLE